MDTVLQLAIHYTLVYTSDMSQSKQCSQTGDRHKILTMTWLSNAGLPTFFSFLVPPNDPFCFLACPPWILLIEEWLVFLLLLHHSSMTSLCSSQICYNGFCRISKWLYRYIADAYSVVSTYFCRVFLQYIPASLVFSPHSYLTRPYMEWDCGPSASSSKHI